MMEKFETEEQERQHFLTRHKCYEKFKERGLFHQTPEEDWQEYKNMKPHCKAGVDEMLDSHARIYNHKWGWLIRFGCSLLSPLMWPWRLYVKFKGADYVKEITRCKICDPR